MDLSTNKMENSDFTTFLSEDRMDLNVSTSPFFADGEVTTDTDLYALGWLCLAMSLFDIIGNVLIIVVYVRHKALHVANRCLIVAVSSAHIVCSDGL